MKKFILTLLLSAFVFVSVHDYIIVSVDHDTQSELYLHESGQISEVCDSTEIHQILHASLIAIDTLFYAQSSDKELYITPLNTPNLFPTSSPESIFNPPIA